MSRYKYRKIYNWDNALAYFAGIMASDGCLANNGRHLILTSKDIELVHTAQHIISNKNKYRIKTGQFGTQAYHFQFSDVSLYDFLLTSGITPAKSKTIKAVAVPDELYPDFLRGYFDGDGTVYGYKDKRWKNSFMYYTSFASASYSFLVWLQNKNRALIHTTGGKIKPGTRAYSLTYAKADSQLIFAAIYRNEPSNKLTRKYEKFATFIKTDPYAKMSSVARVL